MGGNKNKGAQLTRALHDAELRSGPLRREAEHQVRIGASGIKDGLKPLLEKRKKLHSVPLGQEKDAVDSRLRVHFFLQFIYNSDTTRKQSRTRDKRARGVTSRAEKMFTQLLPEAVAMASTAEDAQKMGGFLQKNVALPPRSMHSRGREQVWWLCDGV